MKFLLKRSTIAAGVLILATLGAYIPAMRGGFIWDDNNYVTNNKTLISGAGLGQIWLKPTASPQYYPLVFSSFWLERQLWGLRPVGYHLVNVVLHAFGAVLLWQVLACLKVQGAWLAALIFALHPVHVESVAWITERKNVLSGLFYFASALCLIRFYGLNSKREEIPYRWLWYGLGFVLFLCSLLSKTITFSLPAAIILLLWWKRGRVSWREAMLLLPFFALGLIFGLLTAWLERHHVGAFGLEWDLSFMDRVLIAGRALWFYAQKLIWPVELMFNYPRWQIDEGIWWQYLYPISVLVVLVVLWALRHRLGRGPFVGVSFFCGTLFPALGFIDVFPFRFSFVADHFQYLASTGLIVLAVGGTIRLWDGWLRKSRQLAIAGATLLIVTFCILTWKQCQLYRDEETLWRDTIAKNPDSFLAHNNLGGKLLSCGKLQEAITHFSEALRIDPACVKAHYNMGIALTKQGKLDAAIEHYQEALRIAPNYALAHYNLGLAYGSKGLRDLAFKEMRIAKRLSSGGQWKSIVSGTKGKKPSMPSHP